jgi:hypothetical protein
MPVPLFFPIFAKNSLINYQKTLYDEEANKTYRTAHNGSGAYDDDHVVICPDLIMSGLQPSPHD